ncbi:glycerate kinase [Nocardia terpenica]|uniref:glycerate kinase n=1 Tax=Nocardia terpenica TaxID=455432 RepID=UPI00189507A9|nr:glycerate kinase [Nocardia terpenica]MBF6062894.1 glycerate kinase [Nocardia terpenica]MBF6104971.1 glycerate kinase [Nocardia terpenica]MBF6112592.1 glycerate kinase [Nocardia terpenica]MBF6118699.1 glycerate kinase [Nocardia terpenica]MBF6154168.1 glycerate kinase [Nocardia terpenica]
MTHGKPGAVVLAPDKFKGSLSAPGVVEALAAGIGRVVPGREIRRVPVADGGDGTVDAFLAAGWERVAVTAEGPTGVPGETAYAVRGRTAVIELAAVVGLAKLPGGQPDPLHSGTYGLGRVIAHALDRGAREIVLGVGGSASTDGGAGMLAALGLRILDADGAEVPAGGAALARAVRVERAGLHPALAETSFVLATDVDNPLLGNDGAAMVFGPQKGADPQQCALLEAALTNFAKLVDPAAAERPGAGAAGGTGFGALAVLGAVERPGIRVVLELIGFPDLVRDAALVVTGEGSLDEQTLRGKAPIGVAAAARAAGAPVVAVAGRCLLDEKRVRAAGFEAAYTLSDLEPDPARSIARAAELLEQIGARIAEERLRD